MLSKNPNAVSLSVAIALALATAHVAAAPDSDHGSTGSPRTESSDTKRGPTVEVTARRESTVIDATLAAVRVIDRAEIERRQAGDLMELLRTEAGVDITRSGGVGQATTLFLRGSNSNHTLFLIDGVRVSSANSGLYDLAHLPLANVERIEIVRGPRAAFWGSDAIGGVVQIFTRKVEGYAGRIMAGKYGRLGVDASIGGQGERGDDPGADAAEQGDAGVEGGAGQGRGADGVQGHQRHGPEAERAAGADVRDAGRADGVRGAHEQDSPGGPRGRGVPRRRDAPAGHSLRGGPRGEALPEEGGLSRGAQSRSGPG